MTAPPLVVGIAGGTASGKTTVAARIVEGLIDVADGESFIRDDRPKRHDRPVVLDLDSYYREFSDLPIEERQAMNWDHPDALDVELFTTHIRALKRGEPVPKPRYSFSTYSREPSPVMVHPGPVLVVEGILVLGIEAIRKELDVKVFVDADDDVRVVRRITRDIKDRGRELDSVVEQYFRTVRPMHMGFVEPSKRHADIIIPHGGNNEVAVQMVVGALRGRLGRR